VKPGFTETADTVLGDNGPYDVFLSFNFLEHQPKPGVMLDCIYRNLSEDGMGLITVPSLEYILKYDGYYELIRDHIAYFTYDTLRYLLEHHGFEVLEEEMVNRDTLSVIVRKTPEHGEAAIRELAEDAASPKKPGVAAKPEQGEASPEKAGATAHQESGEASPQKPAMAAQVDVSGLKASFSDIRSQMETLSAQLEEKGQTLAIWGASHQGFTLAATTCLGEKASYIIDSAPFKQGKYAPASHLPILSPDDAMKNPTDVILIVAPGYTEEIAGVIRSRFGNEITILTLRSERIEKMV
jgi:hypothetical protein